LNAPAGLFTCGAKDLFAFHNIAYVSNDSEGTRPVVPERNRLRFGVCALHRDVGTES
jgi:hypothetical protein